MKLQIDPATRVPISDQIVAGVEARQAFIRVEHETVAQAVLLPEDYGLGGQAQGIVDFGVGDFAFAQTAIGALVLGAFAVEVRPLFGSEGHAPLRCFEIIDSLFRCPPPQKVTGAWKKGA